MSFKNLKFIKNRPKFEHANRLFSLPTNKLATRPDKYTNCSVDRMSLLPKHHSSINEEVMRNISLMEETAYFVHMSE